MEERMDRRLALIGSIMIVLFLGFLFVYQQKRDSDEVVSRRETVEQSRTGTIEGYEEPEELVRYMLCQFQKGDLELALRGCAIQETADNFRLQSYIEFTEDYAPMEILPPSEDESPAYRAISQMRLEGYYARWLKKCEEVLGPSHEVFLLGIEEDVPENPDGKYYQNRKAISEMLGARKVYEALIYVRVDDEVKELRWTLARHKKYWGVLAFNPLDRYAEEEPDIRNSSSAFAEDLEKEYMTGDILPANYVVLEKNKEETPEELLQRFFLYLMRQDVMSAGSYVELYGEDEELHTTQALLENHEMLARKIQAFYYRLFFANQNTYDWYFRDLSTRAENIVKDIRCDQIVTMGEISIQTLEELSDKERLCQVNFRYNGEGYSVNFILENHEGWYIKNFEW